MFTLAGTQVHIRNAISVSSAVFADQETDRLVMRGIPVSEKYCGIKSGGIIYNGLAK